MNGVETKPVFELILFRENQGPGPTVDSGERPLEVNVLFTGIPTTVRAMETAVHLARGWNARVRILVAQAVPYAVPLETPPVLVEFQENLFRNLAQGHGVETRVEIFLCRDADETFTRNLSPHSVVVLGAPRRWWPTREEKLARRLRRLGHEVIVVCGKKENTHA